MPRKKKKDLKIKADEIEDKIEKILEPEPEPEPVLIEKTPIVVEEPKPVEALIPLRVFEKISGKRWDQFAGFKYYAEKNKLGPMTVLDWRTALATFMKKPTR